MGAGTFRIHSFGCRANQADGSAIARDLGAAGWLAGGQAVGMNGRNGHHGPVLPEPLGSSSEHWRQRYERIWQARFDRLEENLKNLQEKEKEDDASRQNDIPE